MIVCSERFTEISSLQTNEYTSGFESFYKSVENLIDLQSKDALKRKKQPPTQGT